MSKYHEAIAASARTPSSHHPEEIVSIPTRTAIPEMFRMGVWNSLTPVRVDTVEKGGVTSAPGRGQGRVQGLKQSLSGMGVRHVACSAALTAIVTGWWMGG